MISSTEQLPNEDNLQKLPEFPSSAMKNDWLCKSNHIESSGPLALLIGWYRVYGRKGVGTSSSTPTPTPTPTPSPSPTPTPPKLGINTRFLSTVLISYAFIETVYSMLCIRKHYPELKQRINTIVQEQKIKQMKAREEAERLYHSPTSHVDETVKKFANDEEKFNTQEGTRMLDTDIQRPFMNDLDTPSYDKNIEDVKEEQEKPIKKYITHEELRARNRQSFDNKSANVRQEKISPEDIPNAPKTESSIPNVKDKNQPKSKNAYGDTWDE